MTAHTTKATMLTLACAFLISACSGGEGTGPASGERYRATLTQGQGRLIEVRIAGPAATRAIQATLRFAPQRVTVTRFSAGGDIGRHDAVFSSALAAANQRGALTMVASDTRQVAIPARAQVFRFELAAAAGDQTDAKHRTGSTQETQLQLTNIKVVETSGAAIKLKDTATTVSM